MEPLLYIGGFCAIGIIALSARLPAAGQMALWMIPITISVWFVSQAFETKDSYRPRHEEYPMAWTGRQK